MSEQQINLFNSRCPWYPEGVFKSFIELNAFKKEFNDGKRIFINRLIFYNRKDLTSNMISIGQLFLKDFGIEDSK